MKQLTLLLIVLALAFPSLAQEDNPPIGPALSAHLDDLDDTTSNLRELKILAPVERVFPSRAEAAEYFRDLLDEELTPELVHEATQFYLAFDFVEHDIDLVAIYAELLISQIAGFYDPETGSMNVLLFSEDELGDSLPLLEQIFYVHEYTHALQDQHFGLTTFLEDVEEQGDLVLARQALAEGDATFVMQNYMAAVIEENPLAALSLLTNQTLLEAEIPEGTPSILEAELLMPYEGGLLFVTALYADGGTAAIDNAFLNPPQSTEQILHPERYLRGENPQTVTVDESADALGDGWSLLTGDTLGEFYLREYLETQIGSRDAASAAGGWGGDQYALFYNEGSGQRAWTLRLAWDSAGERAEFASAFEGFIQARYGDDLQTAIFDAAQCWLDAQDAICMAMLGDDVLITQAPDVEQSMALIEQETGG